MKYALLLSLTFLASCTNITEWREMRTAPMKYAECYDGVVDIATHNGFTADTTISDRGLGVWQSRWRERVADNAGRSGRYRLRAEVMMEEGSTTSGWPLRFAIEQQKVKDLRKSMDPTEDDWSDDGQYGDREVILAEQLVRRLVPEKP
jgi:hypothetical protein